MNQLIFDFAERGYPGFDKFLGTENAELVYVLQHKHDPFIYVWGEEGAGKSHLLRAWVAQALDAGKKAVYIDAAATPLTEAAFEAEYLAIDQIEKLGNEEHGIVPQQIKKQVKDIIDGVYHEEDGGKGRLKGKNKVKVGEIHNEEDAIKEIAKLEKAMQQAARDLQFEEAAVLRDRIRGIKENLLFGAE